MRPTMTPLLRAFGPASAITACLAGFAVAQEQSPSPPASEPLPRDLTPVGMFLTADPLVKAVLLGLVFASIVTWTVWLKKTIELFIARRRLNQALSRLEHARSLTEAV